MAAPTRVHISLDEHDRDHRDAGRSAEPRAGPAAQLGIGDDAECGRADEDATYRDCCKRHLERRPTVHPTDEHPSRHRQRVDHRCREYRELGHATLGESLGTGTQSVPIVKPFTHATSLSSTEWTNAGAGAGGARSATSYRHGPPGGIAKKQVPSGPLTRGLMTRARVLARAHTSRIAPFRVTGSRTVW